MSWFKTHVQNPTGEAAESGQTVFEEPGKKP
jgi:hypothetical protein